MWGVITIMKYENYNLLYNIYVYISKEYTHTHTPHY